MAFGVVFCQNQNCGRKIFSEEDIDKPKELEY